MMANVDDTVCPASTVMLGGVMVAMPVPLDRAITVPPTGAGELIVTLLAVVGRPPTTVVGESVSAVIRIGFTVRVAARCATYVAVIVTGVSLETGSV